MLSKYSKTIATYCLILMAGLAVGWGVPRLYERLKPAYTESDYSGYYIDISTNVLVYGTPTCPYCVKARAYLRDHHIKFTDMDVTTNDKAKSDLEKLGSRSVPVLLIGRRRIDGFNSLAIQDALEAAGHKASR